MMRALAFAGVLLAAAPARGLEIEPDEATRAFAAARTLFDDGKLAEAAESFRSLNERLPSVGLLYDRAVCLERLGDRAAAVAQYDEALARAQSATDRELIAERLAGHGPAELRGVVMVVTRPAGAVVRRGDGNDLGLAPWSSMLDGRQELVISLRRYRSERRTLEARQRELAVVAVDLAREAEGWFTVRSDTSNTQLFVDGEPVGSTPYLGSISVGRHTLALIKPGYAEATRRIDIVAGAENEVTVPMTPLSPPLPAAALSTVSPDKRAAPWRLAAGGILVTGSVTLGLANRADGAPAVIGVVALGIVGAVFLTWGLTSL